VLPAFEKIISEKTSEMIIIFSGISGIMIFKIVGGRWIDEPE